MTGRRGVHQQQVRRVVALELFHLAEHQDVTYPRDRGRNDVEGTRRDEPFGEAPHAVVGEVLEQGVVGGDPASEDLAPRLGPVDEHGAVVLERTLLPEARAAARSYPRAPPREPKVRRPRP